MEKEGNEWLTVGQAAETMQALGVPVSAPTLNVWRCTGREKIPFHRFGRLIRYHRQDLLDWAQSRRFDPAEAEIRARKSRR